MRITAADSKPLLSMQGWEMGELNDKDGNRQLNYDRRPEDPPFYQVGATFISPDDEHYYGLGQNQEGYLDHRGHKVECWADYQAAGGQSFCVPFLVTNKGYGLLWDNPSKTTVLPGFNEQTKRISQVGQRVRFLDDGQTYAYEKGDCQITHLHWDDAAPKLTQTGAKAWSGDVIPEVVRGR